MSNPRKLAESWTAYRIGDPQGQWPIYSPEGSRRIPGRWHSRGDSVIYASQHYSTSMLEKLVYCNGVLPSNQHFIEIRIPAKTSYEVFSAAHTPTWHSKQAALSRDFGHKWYVEQRSAVLVVPSVVARIENNILINHDHPDARRIKPGLETPVWWDQRLFA